MIIEPPQAWKDAQAKETSLSSTDEKIDSMLQLIEAIANRVSTIEQRLEAIDGELRTLNQDMDRAFAVE